MLDAHFISFVIVAATLVISPGASMAVVTEVALERGRFAALCTVAGINIANSSLALASMFGLSALLHQWPWLLRIVSMGGALYLAYLGVRALTRIQCTGIPLDQAGTGTEPNHRTSAVALGIMTNLLNPSVVLFYMLLLPQFIQATDTFVPRFLLLAGAHVFMSLLWLSCYALAIGTLSEHMARPWVRRSMKVLTAAVLIFLSVKLAVGFLR
jgi:threonine/homoserine/homoserine lactone efflux protein